MIRGLLVSGLVLGGLAFAGPPAAAAPLAPSNQTIVGEASVLQVGYRRYCRRWHWTCRDRWGFGWRYRRCMRRHGC